MGFLEGDSAPDFSFAPTRGAQSCRFQRFFRAMCKLVLVSCTGWFLCHVQTGLHGGCRLALMTGHTFTAGWAKSLHP